MPSQPPTEALPGSWKTRAALLMTGGILLIMFLTNPNEKGFRKYIYEYVVTESGATISPKEIRIPVSIHRNNYYLYSTYAVNLDGVEHHYMGMFGSYHNYY